MINQCLMESKLCDAWKITKVQVLKIMLVDVLCDCSWYILSILMVLFIVACQRYQKTNRESVRSNSLRDMSASLVSQAGFWWIDQLVGTLRQQGVPAPLLRIDFECFLQRRCVGYGVNFLLCCYYELSKSVHRSEYEPNYESRQSILGEG